jgi:hypothetical protein
MGMNSLAAIKNNMTVSSFFATLDQAGLKFKFVQKPGIDAERLLKIENALKVKLPQELRDFYQLTNGIEGEDFIFNIIPFDEVDVLNDGNGKYLIFAEYLIYSDTFGVELDESNPNKYRIFNWTGDANSLQRKYKTDSVVAFIKQYCEKGTFSLFYDD